MKPRIYIETTVPSYLTAWASSNAIMAGHQQTTREWWAACRERFDLHVSQLVIDEAGGGDAEAARKRLEALEDVPELALTEAALDLATALVAEGAVPEKARSDAVHIAIATVHEMDFIVTWNFKHMANAQMEPEIREVCRRHGWRCPVICTPEQLLPPEEEDTP